MSHSADKKTGRARIAIVIGIAAAALFASLFAVVSVGMSSQIPESPMLANEEQILAKRANELPEVKSFLQTYPDAAVESPIHGTSGDYEFEHVKPYPYLEEVVGQAVSLSVLISKRPDPEDIQEGMQKQHREYYYYAVLRCSPVSLDDPERSRFPDRIWQESDRLCEVEKKRMTAPLSNSSRTFLLHDDLQRASVIQRSDLR